MTIYWVDDDEQILELIGMVFKDVPIQKYSAWSKVPELKAGDIVFHDHDGVGPMPEKVVGVRYFRCSGTMDTNVFVDFPKPFDVKAIETIIKTN